MSFDSFQSALRFVFSSFQHTAVWTDVQLFLKRRCSEKKKKGQKQGKKRVKEYEQGGESDTFTPSCQFACGPPSLWVLGCFFCPPLSPCLVLSLKSKPGYVVSEEMKAGEGSDERLGKTWGWKCGDGQRIDGSAKILCHPSKSR